MATKEQLQEWLSEAEVAYHRVMMGGQEVRVRDSNGDEVTFNSSNASRLLEYIKWLRSQLANFDRQPLRRPLRPMFS